MHCNAIENYLIIIDNCQLYIEIDNAFTHHRCECLALQYTKIIDKQAKMLGNNIVILNNSRSSETNDPLTMKIKLKHNVNLKVCSRVTSFIETIFNAK